MIQFFLTGPIGCGIRELNCSPEDDINRVIESQLFLPRDSFYVLSAGGCKIDKLCDGDTAVVFLKLNGGIDFQHREGSKTGSGGLLSESQAAVERRERLRKLALETIDISKDPYIMRNNLGTFECKLCLTLHNNEGNYLAHTQGKRHQSNLARRAAMEAKNAPIKASSAAKVTSTKTIRIGKPGYKVTKSRDLQSKQRVLSFEIEYPEGAEGVQPRHRFMSAFEQKIEAPDKNYQYLLFSCEPYETIGFKIPSLAVDRREGRFFTNWDKSTKHFVLQLSFLDTDEAAQLLKARESVPARRPQQLNFI